MDRKWEKAIEVKVTGTHHVTRIATPPGADTRDTEAVLGAGDITTISYHTASVITTELLFKLFSLKPSPR
jgi:hypothetical protein